MDVLDGTDPTQSPAVPPREYLPRFPGGNDSLSALFAAVFLLVGGVDGSLLFHPGGFHTRTVSQSFRATVGLRILCVRGARPLFTQGDGCYCSTAELFPDKSTLPGFC